MARYENDLSPRPRRKRKRAAPVGRLGTLSYDPRLKTFLDEVGRDVRTKSGDPLGSLGAGFVQGVDIATGIPAFLKDPTDPFKAANVALLAPVGKIGGLALRTGKQLTGTRNVRYKDFRQQFPSSPATTTAYGQRLLDKGSEVLARKVDVLRDSESALARATGKVLTPPSARARVPKQAGKRVRQESRRRQAALAVELRSVKNANDQAAHFWFAQLPREYRNAQGLQLLRGKLVEEQAYVATGGARKEFEKRILEAEEAGDLFAGLAAKKALKDFDRDAPRLLADQGAQLRKVDQLIAKPPVVDDSVIDSLGVLMRDHRDIFVNAGKLDPKRAGAREGLLSRYLGIKPTGEEIYLGHRQGQVRGARSSGLPGGASVGKTSLPEGVATENKLYRVKSGRVRQDLGAALEDWQAAQVYHFHNVAKDELARLGEEIIGRPKPGYVVVNPRGHELPRTWKTADEEQALAEGFDPDDVLVSDAKEYLANYLAEGADIEGLLQKAAKAGQLKDLRQVPADVARRYYSQFLPTKIQAATPGVKAGAGALGKTFNFANDLVYLSLIYSNPGYIPANFAGNLVMAGAQQGALLPINLIRAGQVMLHAPQRLRDLLRAEVGHGASVSLAGTSPVKKVAGFVGKIPDDTPRIAAFIHEAARVGVISKGKPYLSKNDYAKLESFLTDPNSRPILNDVQDRAVQAMVDFDRLGSMEQAIAKRLLFVWPWIRGATRYPFRFALDHPIRTSILAYGGVTYGEEIKERVVGKEAPTYLRGAVKLGEKTIKGKTAESIFPTRSISPVGTTLEMAETLLARPGARTFAEMLNPAITSTYNVASGKNRYGQEVGYAEAGASEGKRLTPNVGLIQDLISPPKEGGLYPEDVTRLGRLKRASRVAPYAIDPEIASSLARAERGGRKGVQERMQKDVEFATRVGGKPPPEFLEALKTYHYYRYLVDGLDPLKDKNAPEPVQKLANARRRVGVLLAIDVQRNPERKASAQEIWEETKGDLEATEDLEDNLKEMLDINWQSEVKSRLRELELEQLEKKAVG